MRVPPPDIVQAAQAAQTATGVLASISLAQWALESGWGAHVTGEFNFFGVKAQPGFSSTLCWTHEVVDGKSVSVKAAFRNYNGVADAFLDHAKLLTSAGYRGAAASLGDPEAFARAISLPNHPAYATDPSYADKLIALIGDEKFAAYDLPPTQDTQP